MSRDEAIHKKAADTGEWSPNILWGCDAFRTMPEDVLQMLYSRMEQQSFASGEFLMRQGAPGTSLMVVCEGVVEINTVDEAGTTHFIDRAAAGSVLGEMALLTGEPRTANAVALRPVQALVLDAETFHAFAHQHPVISVLLTHLIAQRLGHSRRDVLAGKTLGGYRIHRRLGRGGMAVIYEAIQEGTKRQVALKMMSHRLVYDSQALERFQREADVIQAFAHQDIVQMFGRFAALRTYFIVMEYCDGQSLDEVIKANGPLEETEIRKIFGRVGRAMNYAHQRGVIHRDVKPQNIMLLRDGSLKLTDFGLATPLDNTADDSLSIAGTPRYMAPEQLAGSRVDEKADYFALGCVAYEMLTGQPLLAETRLEKLVQRHASWTVPSLTDARPGISRELCEAVERCLSKDPSQRELDQHRLKLWAAPIDTGLIADREMDALLDTTNVDTIAE